MKKIYFVGFLFLFSCSGLSYNPDAMMTGSRQISNAISGGYQTNGNPYQQAKQIDFTCQNRCLSSGYMYDFCKSKCEY